MKRIKLQLRDLKPNPFKIKIRRGDIDPVIVAQIKESATKTSFWEQWVVRETDRGYELAFGHHRLAAALEMFEESHEVSVQVEPYTDKQMLIALADENAGAEESVEAQVDVIRAARTYVIENPDSCKISLHRVTKSTANPLGAGRKHEHGSVRCLIEFLGETNWDVRKLENLLTLADKVDRSILSDVSPANNHGRNVLGPIAAGELGKLEKPAQIEIVQALKKAQKDLTEFRTTELAKREAKNLPRAALKYMPVHVPTAVIKTAVRLAEALPPMKQAAAVTKHIQHEIAQRKDCALTASVPDAEKVVAKIIAQCFNFPHDETVQELLAGRGHISDHSKTSLLSAFAKLKVRITKYEETLQSAAPLQLKGKH